MEDVELEELLARCASEAIHNPGAVQPHGALLVLDQDQAVVAGSANLEAIVGTSIADVLGRRFTDGFDPTWCNALDQAKAIDQVTVDRGSAQLSCTAEHSGEHLLFEVEPDGTDHLDDGWRLHQTMTQLMGAPTPAVLVDRVVAAIADLTGFDRVMGYRFDAEWHGEVIAERAAAGVESFDGLRFPASDIPPQARAQYERTPLRLIPDSLAEPVPLLAVASLPLSELDLSDARLRAVSPIHLRYLQNLGVRSSMSVSLTVEGRLWGIVACHHTAGSLRPSRRVRTVVDLVARVASMLLTTLEAGQATEQHLRLLRRLDGLTAALARVDDEPPIETLANECTKLLDLVGATGAVLVSGSWTRSVGTVPPMEVTADLIERSRAAGTPLAFDELGSVVSTWREHATTSAGALVVPVSPTGDRSITWYRPEVVETVRWAGDPSAKTLDQGADGLARLGPRASFATYAEVVHGCAAPWTEQEVEIAVELASRLADADVLQADRDARLAAQLQQTLLLESFPDITGVEGSAEYRPASNGPIGGDWYDVFYLPSGRSIVALGDVAGHGLEVAAVMAQLRHALRAYLVRAPSPDVALARLNHLTRTLLPAEMATAVLVELDPPGRSVRIANAGHLPPVLTGPAGSRLMDHRGMALGLSLGAQYASFDVQMDPGERLVLYSDGLIERRSRLLDAGVERLVAEVAATNDLPVADQCIALADRLTDGTDVDDDVTVVVVEMGATTTA